jgi:hypothetical protein
MSQSLNSAVAVIGIDIGKNTFHVVGLDDRGATCVRSGRVVRSKHGWPICGWEQCSNARPDTLMQDRSPPTRQIFLLRTAGPYIWVKSRHDGLKSRRPLFPQKRRAAKRH